MSTWAIIPIRSGSVGLPNKNVMNLGGRPLVAWAMDAARDAKCFDRIMVDTDSPSYAEVAGKWSRWGEDEVHVTIRPPHLAADVPTEDVLAATLRRMEARGLPDTVACLQCTTPLVDPKDIAACVHAVKRHGFDSATTVTKITERPEWMFARDVGGMIKLHQGRADGGETLKGDWGIRQTFPELYRPTGACYVMTLDLIYNKHRIIGECCAGIETPRLESFDIDTREDFELLTAIIDQGLLHR